MARFDCTTAAGLRDALARTQHKTLAMAEDALRIVGERVVERAEKRPGAQRRRSGGKPRRALRVARALADADRRVRCRRRRAQAQHSRRSLLGSRWLDRRASPYASSSASAQMMASAPYRWLGATAAASAAAKSRAPGQRTEGMADAGARAGASATIPQCQ